MSRALGQLTVVLILTLSGPVREGLARPPAPPDSVRTAVELGRVLKDSVFANSPDSPLPAPMRSTFTGLRYFPYAPRYRVPVTLQAYARRRIVPLPATRGTTVDVERYGLVVGTLDGKTFRLVVYRAPGEDVLEVFFADPTNGDQTYGGGRYVRLQQQDDGGYVLDFNTAYNPYCAFSPDFVCPLPPVQNHLQTPVRAGEMIYGANLAKP